VRFISIRQHILELAFGSNWIDPCAVKMAAVLHEDEVLQCEDRPCTFCGGAIPVVKMDHRLLGRYTCPHCGREVTFSDEPGSSQ
jgi:hypothetical protein